MLVVSITGDGVRRFTQLARELGDGRARSIYSRAINDTGAKAATATGRALADQSGLAKRVGAKAVKKRIRSTPATLAYEIPVKGGEIRLKYFKARETRKGVSGAPRNQRQVFAGTFMKAGWWPKRVVKGNWNGQVFRRVGNKFQVVKSDVVLPTEATTGNTAATFDRGKDALDVRVTHYLRRLAGGALT
ncbi:MAG: hypothetical protein BGO06_15550 [Shinella sp. 65-6]|nr:hypothetical protein [Hyphomicrobiales bacterium]OJU92290.1 MAG: hypothetical protein BGO06_15550 [Shinella sp. 65-6]